MFRFVKDFLLHRLTAKTRHGIHSPFVYRLVDQVIYDKGWKDDYKAPECLRSELLNDRRIIRVTDLGAGSHVNNRRQKAISNIAKNALKPPALAQLLYRLANNIQPLTSIELGTCLGVTTVYLAKAAPSSKVISVEGDPEISTVAKETIDKSDVKNVTLMTGNFDEILPEILAALPAADFVFIDGNHRKQATLDYFKACLPKTHENSLLIFDDIYWSDGMKEAWREIKAHPEVTLTIDLFWIGLVFFRKGRVKEEFKIRY